MELKKTAKADLQNKKSLFLEIGLCISLLLMILLFRMSQNEAVIMDMGDDREIIENEMVEITFEEQKPPEVQQTVVQSTVDILNIVRDDKKIETSLSFADFDQDVSFVFEPVVSTTEEVVDTDEPFQRVENMPTFQGGDLNTFRNWVQGRMRYPAIASENGISGRVMLEFIVERDGSVSNINVLQSPDRSLSEEAARVVATSPKWTPGSQRGVPARVKFIVPIDFRLQ
ncbi:MAG: energy transducer TonB [Rikenellaceae bacterium]|jgi:protein TonB|nr:energy transducer TonB [Rikenellaceae bacterium]